MEVAVALNAAYIGLDRFRDKNSDSIIEMRDVTVKDIKQLCIEGIRDGYYDQLIAFPEIVSGDGSESIRKPWVGYIGLHSYKALYCSDIPEYFSAFLILLMLVSLTISGFIGTGLLDELSFPNHTHAFIIGVTQASMWVPVLFFFVWYFLNLRAKKYLHGIKKLMLNMYKKQGDIELKMESTPLTKN